MGRKQEKLGIKTMSEIKIKGYYFRSKSCDQQYYSCRVDELKFGQNCKIIIRELDIYKEGVKNGEEVEVDEYDGDGTDVMTLDVWPKYYFPEFLTSPQWYHNEDGKEDYIQAQAEVLQFALNLAKTLGKITTY